MPNPEILNQVVRFHREHNTPQNEQPVGELHSTRGVETLGFLRGTNIAKGQAINVQTADGRKVWDGTIGESVDDDFTGEPFNEGPAWFFTLTMTCYPSEGEVQKPMDDTIAVTVTVTDARNGSSRPVRAFPDPKDVP